MSPSMSGKQPTAGSSSPPNDHLVQDAVVLDMPPLNRFSINVPSEPSRPISTPISSDRPALSSSESGQSSDDDGDDGDESGQDRENGDTFDANYSPTISTTIRPSLPDKSALIFPHFSRAFSLPLPSQLGHLKHPHRPLFSLTRPSYSESASPEAEQFKELSLELADSVQMVIQTMLQISPTQILDPAKEQFSACSMAVPAPSMSAMLTAMKNLNYISANMAAFAAEETLLEDTPLFSNRKHNDFDIGELLQSVGDALSASVAQAGVDLVLFHGDATLKHVWVKGDEPCMSYLLSHLIRQILTTCQRGDTIELGLFVNPLSSPRRQNSLSSETDEDDPFRTTSYGEGSLECVVEIFHRFLPAGTSEGLSRPQPTFLALATRRLLSQLGATLSDHTPSFDGSLEIGRSSRLSFALDSGLSPQPTPNAIDETQSSNEPTLEQLSTFVDSLKGKKVHLHSSSKSPFAHHLTSYLTTWGMDVSHISTEGGEESLLAPPSSPTTVVSSSNNLEGYTPSGIPPKVEPPRPPKSQPVSFVVIDDDVAALKERLQSIRDEQNYPLHLNSRKRPSLASHHRPRSTSQVTRLPPTVATPHASVILHFTSLANYKATKNLVQSFLDFYRSTVSPLPVPEIMVIPKPAGPRRLLTALHTAATRPPVDPFFSPIATTPGTPSFGISYIGSPLQQHQQSVPRTSSLHRPSGSRSNSDRSSRSTQILENHGNLPPSPLSMQDSTEYFSDTVTKLGETPVKLGVTPRAGVILQSPDGQPAGIFFSPRAEKSNVLSSYSMERDRGQLSVSSGSRRSLSSKEGPSVTFSSLHEVASIEGPSPRSSEKEKDSPTTSRQYSRGNVSPTPADAPDTQTGRGVSVESVSRKSAIATPTISPPGSPMVEPSISSLRNVRRPKMDSKGLSPAPSSKKGKSPADNNIVPPISVLIVDDNHINRHILSTFMKKNHIKYDVASNGKEAVEKWKTGEFHLILMDIQMPVMDGMEATRMIRQIERQNAGYIQPSPSIDSDDRSALSDDNDSRTSAASPYRSSVIIVALTASSLQSDRIAALAAGCNDFLTKPVSFPWLNNKLIEWGSIKALSMYADMTPDVVRSQNDQARNIAERLHFPKGKKAPPPPVSRSPRVLPSPAGLSAPPQSPRSGSSSAIWSLGQPSAALSFRSHVGLKSPVQSESPTRRNFQDEPMPSFAHSSSVTVDLLSPLQTPSAEKLNGSVEISQKVNLDPRTNANKTFDPNASTTTLKRGDVFRARDEEVNNAPLEHVRENGSISSASRSPSPTTPATPSSPVRPVTIKEKIKLGEGEDSTLDLNVPGGCVEIYNESEGPENNSLVVTP